MVTKQQQLAWLVSKIVKWPADGAKIPVSIDDAGNPKFYMPWDAFAPWDVMRVDFTHEEWQQERDKMQKRNEYEERGELPPVGVPVELWVGGSFAYNCEFITRRRHHYVMWNLDADRPDAADYMNSEFRPIRTEREKAIDEMVSVILDYDGYMITSATAKLVARQLHDSGYHK